MEDPVTVKVKIEKYRGWGQNLSTQQSQSSIITIHQPLTLFLISLFSLYPKAKRNIFTHHFLLHTAPHQWLPSLSLTTIFPPCFALTPPTTHLPKISHSLPRHQILNFSVSSCLILPLPQSPLILSSEPPFLPRYISLFISFLHVGNLT